MRLDIHRSAFAQQNDFALKQNKAHDFQVLPNGLGQSSSPVSPRQSASLKIPHGLRIFKGSNYQPRLTYHTFMPIYGHRNSTSEDKRPVVRERILIKI
jgi:hypothetical protein